MYARRAVTISVCVLTALIFVSCTGSAPTHGAKRFQPAGTAAMAAPAPAPSAEPAPPTSPVPVTPAAATSAPQPAPVIQPAPAEQPAYAARPEDALLIVLNRVPIGRREGYAVAIGDGTLAVTALHVARETSEYGKHESDGTLNVISPYLGDVSGAKIIATNSEWDLAIIELPWRGHPAIRLATPEETSGTPEVRFARLGWPEVTSGWQAVKTEKLPLHSVATIDGVQVKISTRGFGSLKPGWSGCPMLNADGTRLVGCFTNKETGTVPESLLPDDDASTDASERLGDKGCGPAAGLIRQAVVKAGKEDALERPAETLSRPPHADEATTALLSAFAKSKGLWSPEAVTELDAFIALRPTSARGAVIKASWLSESKDKERFEAAYARALELRGECATVHSVRASYLVATEDYAGALEELRRAKRLDPDDGNEMGTAQILLVLKRYDACAAELAAAIKRYPNDAYLLMVRAGLHEAREDEAAGIVDIEKAARLYPESTIIQSLAGTMCQKAGMPKKAERHFRAVMALMPDKPKGYWLLAELIADKRPKDRDEGIALARQALALPDITDFDRDAVQKTLDRLEALPKR